VKISIVDIEPGNVAFQALGYAGLVVVVVAGWTTANANLYRSGLAAQGVVPTLSRRKATLIIGVIVLVASAFPFVYRNYLIFITYSGITLVPVGGIIFASYWVLPRLGMTTFWAGHKGVTNTPALLAWGITLALAACAVGFGLMPVYFAFVPAFILSIVLYVVFAKMMGAAESYPEGEAEDERFNERVDAFHAEQAKRAPTDIDTKDRSSLSKGLRVLWIVALVVIFAMALFVLLGSPDVGAYTDHRDQFFWVAGIGTLVYFAAAYWELRRRKAVAEQTMAEYAEQPA
ncbi:MAG: hypothetical protein WA892_04405, partial [Ornithinimicrobium sp.]